MKQLACMIVWTPAYAEDSETRGQVAIVPWPDPGGRRRPYSFSVGACYSVLHTMSEADRIAQLFMDFNTIVVRDGIDPQVAHLAFLQIDEYRERISPDMVGAVP